MKFLLLLLLSFQVHAVVLNGSLMEDGSMASSATSSALLINTFSGYSISATISSASSASGTLVLQTSNDNLPPSSIVNWSDITSSSQIVNSNGTTLWNVADAYYKYVRVKYTLATGTGVLNIRYNIKNLASEIK